MKKEFAGQKSEAGLIISLQKGNEKAMLYFTNRYSPALYGFIIRIVSISSLANQVLVDSFIEFWKYIPSHHHGNGRLFTHLSNMARNIALHRLQNRVDPMHEQKPDNALLEKFIREVPLHHRTILEMHFITRHSLTDISGVLHISREAATARISAACKQLDAVLKNNRTENATVIADHPARQISLAQYYSDSFTTCSLIHSNVLPAQMK